MAQALNPQEFLKDANESFPLAIRAVSQDNPFDGLVLLGHVEQEGDGLGVTIWPNVDKDLTLHVSAVEKVDSRDWTLTTTRGPWAFRAPLNEAVARAFVASMKEG